MPKRKIAKVSRTAKPVPMAKQSSGDSLIGFISGFVVFWLIFFFIASILTGITIGLVKFGFLTRGAGAYIEEAEILLSLSISAFAYLLGFRHSSLRSVLDSLGISLSKFSFLALGIGVMVFAMLLCVELMITLAGQIANVGISTNVANTFSGAPTWFYAFAATIEPINEEIFFRGFMITRIASVFAWAFGKLNWKIKPGYSSAMGIIVSAIFFGLAHTGYNSTFGVEVIAAFIFGLIAGFVYMRTGSLYPSMFAHILVNTMAAVSVLGGM